MRDGDSENKSERKQKMKIFLSVLTKKIWNKVKHEYQESVEDSNLHDGLKSKQNLLDRLFCILCELFCKRTIFIEQLFRSHILPGKLYVQEKKKMVKHVAECYLSFWRSLWYMSLWSLNGCLLTCHVRNDAIQTPQNKVTHAFGGFLSNPVSWDLINRVRYMAQWNLFQITNHF